MKIDIATGALHFDAGTIDPTTDVQAFLASPCGRKSSPIASNDPYSSHVFQPETGVTAAIFFRESRVTMVHFSFALPGDEPGHWTEEHEQLRKLRHDQWLAHELGSPPYDYEWGRIASVYSERDGESDVVVTYDRRVAIAADSGVLTFGANTLDPRLDQSAFLHAPIGRTSRFVGNDAGLSIFEVEPAPGLYAHVCFRQDRLASVYMSLPMPSDWVKTWRNRPESYRQEAHDRWLRDQLGAPPYIYAWGEAVSMPAQSSTVRAEIHIDYTGIRGPADRLKRRLRHWARRLQEID